MTDSNASNSPTTPTIEATRDSSSGESGPFKKVGIALATGGALVLAGLKFFSSSSLCSRREVVATVKTIVADQHVHKSWWKEATVAEREGLFRLTDVGTDDDRGRVSDCSVSVSIDEAAAKAFRAKHGEVFNPAAGIVLVLPQLNPDLRLRYRAQRLDNGNSYVTILTD